MVEKTTPSPGAAAVAGAVVAKAITTALIDAWFAKHFQQPPISHSTDCYNQAVAARDELKSMLPKA